MEKSAEVVIQNAQQPTLDLHQNVSQQLQQMGHSAEPATVNPGGQSPLDELKKAGAEVVGDAANAIGTTVGETIGGEGTHIRQNKSVGWFKQGWARAKKKAQFWKKAG